MDPQYLALPAWWDPKARKVIFDDRTIVCGLLVVGASAVAFAGGGGFVLYGIYVLNQTSGTWEFPIFLFLLPLYLIVSSAQASQAHEAQASRAQESRAHD